MLHHMTNMSCMMSHAVLKGHECLSYVKLLFHVSILMADIYAMTACHIVNLLLKVYCS